MGRILHRARVIAFYGLTGLFTVFLTFELFAHLLVPTPVATQWAAPHHIHSLAHAALTAILIPAVGMGLHPRTRRIAGLQSLLLAAGLGLAVSLIAWRGFHDLAFPVFNFTLYGVIAVLLVALHPDRRRLFEIGTPDPWLAAMTVLAAVPLIAYATFETTKQISGVQPIHGGHFALMASLTVVLPALAALAALRPEGSRGLVWLAGLAVGALGLGSVAFPSEASSFGLVAAVAAIAWGATFVSLGSRRVARAH